MRILTGFLAPSQGKVRVAGYDMPGDSLEARRHIGYLPEATPMHTDMSVRSYLKFYARLRGVPEGQLSARLDEVINLCHLEKYADVLTGRLSKGFRQRVGVAQAIIHHPEVLILDEPTIGIDPVQVSMTRKLIRDLGKHTTILLSTHILSEVSMTCQRVIIIAAGKIIAEDTVDRLASRITPNRRFRLEISGPEDKIVKCLSSIEGIARVTCNGACYIVECSAGQDPRAKIQEAMVKNTWTVLSLEPVSMNLEDVFLKLVSREDTGR